ncbi:hypothetical protein PpBr36_07594 [Pyricularia pennisetigena]|uniref:hypothetical protein n=1 Tax=Pyricularia pennisetigena TaxID=1578925 RepID=UPI0011513833|nr:hypothetical protein PpBr36_07594 [Pyricularia pennisetigena]TLS25288.1 hypothetical protein PpBr36_07594 [Pyricularia pennisetigena]
MPTSMQPESPVQDQVQPEVAPASTGQKRSLDEASEDEPALDQQNAPTSSGHASPAPKKIRLSEPGIGQSDDQKEAAIPASPGSPDPEPTETSNMDTGGDGDDDGEDADSDDDDDDEAAKVEDSAQGDGGAVTAAGPRDWNSASHKVVRTSFGAALPALKTRAVLNRITASSADRKSPKDIQTKTNVDADTTNDKAGVESAVSSGDAVAAGKSRSRSKSKSRSRSGSEAPDRSTMRRKSIDWKLPELQLEVQGGRKKQFLAWCQEFCSANEPNAAKADARLLRRGYLIRLEATSIPEQVRKESKKAARNTESSQMDKIISGFVGNAEESCELSEGEIMSESEPAERSENKPSNTLHKELEQLLPVSGGSGKVQLSREEELEQLRLYFPRASKTDFCVICAKNGHRANDCPPPTCRHCQDQGHTSAQCPTRVRCTKCQRLGHIKKSCPEKLASAAGEAELECAVCCATDHLEDDCESLWCTYYPDPENIVKVQSIPAFCYSCGADNHFGGDCGLYNISTHSKDDTWTVANRDRYVDPDTDVLPVSWVPPPPPDPERPDFGGRSIVPQRNHIYFESDDEEEGEFIQPPVRSRPPPPGRQQIRINGQAGASAANGTSSSRHRESRNQRMNDGGSGGGGRSGRNPPLPPGPPPSSLPARPPGGASGGSDSRGGAGGGRRGRGGFSRVRGGHR